MAKQKVKEETFKNIPDKVLQSILPIAHQATVYIHTYNIHYFVLICKHSLSKQLFAFLRWFAEHCSNRN